MWPLPGHWAWIQDWGARPTCRGPAPHTPAVAVAIATLHWLHERGQKIAEFGVLLSTLLFFGGDATRRFSLPWQPHLGACPSPAMAPGSPAAGPAVAGRRGRRRAGPAHWTCRARPLGAPSGRNHHLGGSGGGREPSPPTWRASRAHEDYGLCQRSVPRRFGHRPTAAEKARVPGGDSGSAVFQCVDRSLQGPRRGCGWSLHVRVS